jgi:hypothetical protein
MVLPYTFINSVVTRGLSIEGRLSETIDSLLEISTGAKKLSDFRIEHVGESVEEGNEGDEEEEKGNARPIHKNDKGPSQTYTPEEFEDSIFTDKKTAPPPRSPIKNDQDGT